MFERVYFYRMTYNRMLLVRMLQECRSAAGALMQNTSGLQEYRSAAGALMQTTCGATRMSLLWSSNTKYNCVYKNAAPLDATRISLRRWGSDANNMRGYKNVAALEL